MPLTEEWKRRIERWEKALRQSCYRPLGSLALSGFVTKEQLSAAQALSGRYSFKPMPAGTPWGAKWEYGWFKGEITLPAEAAGHRIVLRVGEENDGLGWEPIYESLVWINGQISGSFGWAHREITLARQAQSGAHYDLLMESYAGHGVMFEGQGPVRYGTESVPEPPPAQVTVKPVTYGIWLEDVYQLVIDLYTLRELRDHLDPLSLRVAEIDQGLMDLTMIVDVEVPEEEMLATVRAGRERLRPLLECKNGSTMPTFYAFGHAHLDVAWLWPWAETERKMARTAINALALFEEYPEYKFLQSQPHLYVMLKEKYPELYQRFKAAVQSGQVIADGAMWVEADTNLTGGESLIRQVMYGRAFFRDELGVDSRVLWLPDVFGYSGALPQILKGCGCVGFSTQKINWAYNGGDPFPYTTFLWEGIDGTTIPAHIFNDYNSLTDPASLIQRWNERKQKMGIRSMIVAFGWGDGGGGPTRHHLEFIKRSGDLEGVPRVRLSSPAEFFQDQGLPKERYVGELYFQAHRGTYTSQAKTKKGNRRSEFALREAELWGCAARALKGFAFSPRTLDVAWRKVMLNQFHDVLPGSSIHRVYEEAEAEYEAAIQIASQTTQAALGQFVSGDAGKTVFNSLSWPRTVLVQTDAGLAEVTVPACGWKTVSAADVKPLQQGVKVSQNSLENEHLRAEFNARGELVSLWDKDSQRELMAGPGNRFLLYKDTPVWFDAWDIDSMAEKQPVAIDEPVTLEVLSTDPLLGQLRLSRKLHRSTLSQVISLRRGSRRIDFATTIDWQESHKLLKVSFPVDIHANESIHEIQFGHLRRPTHRSRPFDADRFEVCNHKWSALAEENRGVAVLNDCKYGLSVLGNDIKLTLLKSALAPDMTADKGLQTFTYALYAWNGSLAESEVVREAYDLNVPVVEMAGAAAGDGSLFSVDAPNVIIETVKPAEDGSADIIVRLYEAKRMATRAVLATALPVRAAVQTNLIEETQADLPCSAGQIKLEFRPFEIKTVRLKL